MGAVALVILVVAAAPMLLDEAPRQSAAPIDIDIPQVPPSPGNDVAEATATAAAPSAPDPGPTAPEAPAPEAGGPAPVPQPAAPAPVAIPPGPLRLAPGAAAAASADQYAVQLIATISPAKAREMRQKLERQKFPVYTERTPDGAKTRVRVGPFESREDAERARQRLQRLDFAPGQVVRKGE